VLFFENLKINDEYFNSNHKANSSAPFSRLTPPLVSILSRDDCSFCLAETMGRRFCPVIKAAGKVRRARVVFFPFSLHPRRERRQMTMNNIKC